MKKSEGILRKNRMREIERTNQKKDFKKKYKSDTPMEKTAVPYIIMLLCATMDGAVFYSLFSLLSFDSPFILMVELAAFLFAFDVVPIYMGLQI
ncbi:MAG: hypothetical protein K6G26_07010, partial [Lachnospiraceae bacterium]|nr:hypothetical protein [Lachnospiraceae bacterium]